MKDAEWNKIALVILLLGGIFGGTWNLTLFINNQSHISKDNNHHNTSDQMNYLTKNSLININQKTSITNYIEHGPISINGNNNFNTTAYNEGWPGNGTITNPFVIEGLNITGTVSNGQIFIQNTNVYFKINNCLIIHNNNIGIYLYNVIHGQLDNNTIGSHTAYGIFLENSQNNTFSNNFFSDNRFGIYFYDSISMINTTLCNNTLIHDSIHLFFSLIVDDYLTLKVDNNTVNGKPLIYLINKNNYEVHEDAGQIIIVKCTSITIANQNLANTRDGISVIISQNITISENKISKSAISLLNSDNNKIFDNTLIESGIVTQSSHANSFYNNNIINTIVGNSISDSNDNKIYLNIFQNNIRSLWLGYSNTNVIFNNIFSNNTQAIVSSFSSNNDIINNIFVNGSGYAISSAISSNFVSRNDFLSNNPSGTSQGFFSQQDIVDHNYWNDWIIPDIDTDGIVDLPYILDSSPEINLDYNPLTDPSCFLPHVLTYPYKNNTLTGIATIEWTPANLFNRIVTYNVSYSPDNGMTWYTLTVDSSSTSYIWDTTSLSDDTHYLIKVTAIWDKSYSYYVVSNVEFTIKNNFPVVPISDITITHTLINNEVSWIATSSNASSYILYQNNSLKASGDWTSGKAISYDISNLAPAAYNFTLVVIDDLGTHVSHSVILTIDPPPDPETTTIISTTTETSITTSTTTTQGTTTNTEVVTSTSIETTISTVISQIVETMSKTTTGFSVVIMGLGLVGFLLIRRKRK